jgi:hypothetical protein
VVTGLRSGEEVEAALARFAAQVPSQAWAELDAG